MDEVWTPPKLVSWIAEDLQKRGLPPSHRLEAEILVSKALNLTRLELFLQFDRPLSEEDRNGVKKLLKRRRNREPLGYITGTAQFWGLELFVGPGVLIPRSDTEVLVEQILNWLGEDPEGGKKKMVEFGAGSLCISLVLATEMMGLEITAIDASPDALVFAKQNLEKYQTQIAELENKIHLVQAESFAAIESIDRLDVIYSNPPYISPSELAGLQPEVKNFEPMMALDGGEEGLYFYHLLATEATKRLVTGGLLAFEHGSDQKEMILKLMEGYPQLRLIKAVQDLSGLDRCMLWEKKDA